MPLAIPPAAITGIETLLTTWGTSAIVVASPICPPASQPSTIKPSTPARSNLLARATLGTTGKTLIPASFHIFIYTPGFPAPVVTTGTCSSITICAISLASGLSNIILTPKGWFVNFLHAWISAFNILAFIPPAPIKPSPPALETLAAKAPVAILAIPPWIIGYLIFNNSFNFILFSLPFH